MVMPKPPRGLTMIPWLVRGEFHTHLAKAGLTPMSPDEMELLGDSFRDSYIDDWEGQEYEPEKWVNGGVRNKVFLYEISQLETERFGVEVLDHLGVDSKFAMPEMFHVKPGTENAAYQTKGPAPEEMEKVKRYKINICDDEHSIVHEALNIIAANASDWIMGYLLKSPRVSFSEGFVELVQAWKIDPCVDRIIKKGGV
ncbi:hypothetical protein TL16_g09271 [Triparma laevis f. inornata]|uniref:Uncharacterized protein n=2 Tax=Triparma laevis TaxID=1534972 RepID=A0A9W7KWB6_9STRA|nr:hypothetical protein TL16_g09271 [Triparma laevis f. inornata]GMI14133.1 hypothetical protein TrLO_g5407 [Triparma laevis f. longispina]